MGNLLWDSMTPSDEFGQDSNWMPPSLDGGGFMQEGAGNGGAAKTAQTWQKLGLFTSILGGINQAFGAYYAAKSDQYQLKSEASSFRFQSDMARLNASAAEKDAQSILNAGQGEIARYTMAAGQQKQAAKTSMAGHGLVLGEGSTRDVEASMDVVKDIDKLTINANTVRAAEAERMRRTSYLNAATMYGVSATNARRSADSISPFMATTTSLLNSATRIASQWDWRRKSQTMAYGGQQ